MKGLRRRSLGRRAAFATLLGATACQRPGPLALPVSMPELPAAPLSGGTALRPLGVLEIDTARFGADGLSGLHIAHDLTLTAISDRGRWGQARLVLAPDGTPLGLEPLRAGTLCDPVGRPLPRNLVSDAESLARQTDGSWLIGFERNHRIWRYPTLDAPAEPVIAPAELALAPGNGGLESLAVLADGRWLAIAESQRPAGEPAARIAWLRGPSGWRRLAYQPAPGFDPSDLCPLPDGGALVLERHFTLLGGFASRIVRLPPIAQDATRLAGKEVARLAPPLPTDNWEGISAFGHGGRGLVAVVSDDNQLILQRTLLMILGEVEPEAVQAAS
ncbi:esterase-like activity of phytase family protein [Roseomonas sp. WA12]